MLKITVISQEICVNDKLKQTLQDDNIVIDEYCNNSVFLSNAQIRQKSDIILWDIDFYNYYSVVISNIYQKQNHPFVIILLLSSKDKRKEWLKKNSILYITIPIQVNELENLIQTRSVKEKINSSKKKLTFNSKIAAYKEEKIFLIDLSNIYFFSSEEGKTIIITKEDEIFTCNHTLKYWDDRLTANNFFFKCHRCFIINVNYIEQITPWYNNTLQAILINSKFTIPISRNYIKDFKEFIGM
ncbi:LytTR family two component transcriptional regulator [Lachnotalea glycerini]|uniref:LytTR family two component transcriptional regulator n=1 Tax=Lachnotalea glycerini TaxID=1763509 RepID=A0A318ET30_9FIRM|nr:LytTR family DNA-binding domain-containing protein [Lachnotalea glycerini]PXV86829.1 LytTR family two component transcriptional regulator [Lachnotalea glycerini]